MAGIAPTMRVRAYKKLVDVRACGQRRAVYNTDQGKTVTDIMSEISQADQASYQLPPGGEWFYTQQPMLEAIGGNDGLAIAWDTTRGAKMYGLYTNMARETLMLNLLDTPVASRHCYELLVENVPCKAYADVEWEGPEDADHSELWRLVAAIRAKVQEELSHEPKIYVSCGSRPSKGDPDVLKHSYHIVLENIIYERNNDNQMKQFFTGIPGFSWMDDFEEKQKVDARVYTKNRVFRLPHCTKSGSTIPLVRISGDPLADELKDDWGRDAQAVLPFFISNPEITGDCKFIQTPTRLLQQVSVAREAKNKRVRTADESAGDYTSAPKNKLFPVPIQVVQSLLVLAGDTVSTLGPPQFIPAEDQWRIQGDQRGHGRKCLVNAGTTHASNNALLFIDRVDTGFRVHYQCMASECATCAKPILGYISMNQETFEWQIALSAPPDAMQDDHQQADEAMEEDSDAPPHDQEMQDASPEVVEPPHDPDNPVLNTYDLVKARFELKCFKVNTPFCYARITKDKDPYIHSHVDLQHYYCDWKYWGLNKDEEMVQLPFISHWLKDQTKRVVERIVIDPSNTMGNVYNMWKGYDAERLPPVADERVPGLIEGIKLHFNDVITNGNEDHSSFCHQYLANILQRPWLKTQVAIFLYGAQGCGKGIIFEFFRNKILGNHCSSQTSKPENDLFGRFANGAVNRVLIQVDEVRSLHDHTDQLKDLITNPTLNYEKKGKDTIVVSNLTNLILTSNNANALTVSVDDRRFALFQCSSTHKGDTKYFQELGAELERPEVARAYYQYLMSLDLSDYPVSFQHRRPVTEFYKETQHNSIPVISRFFSAMINSELVKSKFSCRELYKCYQSFQTTGNYKYLMTETAFGRDVKKIQGVTFKKTKACNLYLLDLIVIKKYLEAINEYDTDTLFIHYE